MPFLTGIDLEGRIKEEEDEAPLLALPAPPPRCRSVALAHARSDLALVDDERPRPEYNKLLKDVSSADDDSLEELQRLIHRTRGKMDAQKKVLHGFISDVHQIRGQERSFSCTDIALPSPSGSQRPQQLQLRDRSSSSTSLALPSAGRSSSSSSLALPSAGRSSSTTSLALPSGGRPRSDGAGAASAPALAAEPRDASLRNGILRSSRSQPMLSSGSAVGGHGAGSVPFPAPRQRDLQPLQMPARRAPPGAPGRQKLQSSAAAAAGRAFGAASMAGGSAGDGVSMTRPSLFRGPTI